MAHKWNASFNHLPNIWTQAQEGSLGFRRLPTQYKPASCESAMNEQADLRKRGEQHLKSAEDPSLPVQPAETRSNPTVDPPNLMPTEDPMVHPPTYYGLPTRMYCHNQPTAGSSFQHPGNPYAYTQGHHMTSYGQGPGQYMMQNVQAPGQYMGRSVQRPEQYGTSNFPRPEQHPTSYFQRPEQYGTPNVPRAEQYMTSQAPRPEQYLTPSVPWPERPSQEPKKHTQSDHSDKLPQANPLGGNDWTSRPNAGDLERIAAEPSHIVHSRSDARKAEIREKQQRTREKVWRMKQQEQLEWDRDQIAQDEAYKARFYAPSLPELDQSRPLERQPAAMQSQSKTIPKPAISDDANASTSKLTSNAECDSARRDQNISEDSLRDRYSGPSMFWPDLICRGGLSSLESQLSQRLAHQPYDNAGKRPLAWQTAASDPAAHQETSSSVAFAGTPVVNASMAPAKQNDRDLSLEKFKHKDALLHPSHLNGEAREFVPHGSSPKASPDRPTTAILKRGDNDNRGKTSTEPEFDVEGVRRVLGRCGFDTLDPATANAPLRSIRARADSFFTKGLEKVWSEKTDNDAADTKQSQKPKVDSENAAVSEDQARHDQSESTKPRGSTSSSETNETAINTPIESEASSSIESEPSSPIESEATNSTESKVSDDESQPAEQDPQAITISIAAHQEIFKATIEAHEKNLRAIAEHHQKTVEDFEVQKKGLCAIVEHLESKLKETAKSNQETLKANAERHEQTVKCLHDKTENMYATIKGYEDMLVSKQKSTVVLREELLTAREEAASARNAHKDCEEKLAKMQKERDRIERGANAGQRKMVRRLQAMCEEPFKFAGEDAEEDVNEDEGPKAV